MQWTAHVAPDHSGTGSAKTVEAAYADEVQIYVWVKRAMVMFSLVVVLNGVIFALASSAWSDYYHQLGLMISAASNGQPVTAAPQPPAWSYLGGSLFLLCEVVFFVWQYRAATTAKLLGYPAKRSPGMGVGSYFIPVVDLWFPYQALRDCLPPGDKNRKVVLWVWLLILATTAVSILFEVSFLLPPWVRFIGVVAGIVFAGTLLKLSLRMVAAINQAHQGAIEGRV